MTSDEVFLTVTEDAAAAAGSLRAGGGQDRRGRGRQDQERGDGVGSESEGAAGGEREAQGCTGRRQCRARRVPGRVPRRSRWRVPRRRRRRRVPTEGTGTRLARLHRVWQVRGDGPQGVRLPTEP